jgi:DNA-binding transcriptional ArsR family regulator
MRASTRAKVRTHLGLRRKVGAVDEFDVVDMPPVGSCPHTASASTEFVDLHPSSVSAQLSRLRTLGYVPGVAREGGPLPRPSHLSRYTLRAISGYGAGATVARISTWT